MTLISTSVCQSNHSDADRSNWDIVMLLVAFLQPNFINVLNSEFFSNIFRYGKVLKLLIFRTILLAHFEKEAQLSILFNPSPFLLSFSGLSVPWTHGDSQDWALNSTNPFKQSANFLGNLNFPKFSVLSGFHFVFEFSVARWRNRSKE